MNENSGYMFRYDDDELIIYCTRGKQRELYCLRAANAHLFREDRALYDEFEEMVANTKLEWIDPVDTWDLTEAPMLGVLGQEEPGCWGEYGRVLVGRWDGQAWFAPINQRWAFMDYMLRSPLDELADNGRVVFRSR